MCKDLGNNNYECQGNCNSNSTIWGTGLYTDDSNVFQAAKHLGIVPGKFRRVNVAGASSYLGTTLNGVSSTNYGNYPNSYYLVSLQNSNAKINGGVTEQSLANMKNQLQTAYQTSSTNIKSQIASLKKELMALSLSTAQQVKKSQQSACQKQTKLILKALKKDASICAICLDQQRSRVVFPCFHASYCQECIKNVRSKGECAVCQGKITGDIKIIL